MFLLVVEYQLTVTVENRVDSKKKKILANHEETDFYILEDVFGLSSFMANQGWGYIVPDSVTYAPYTDWAAPFFIRFSVSHSLEAACCLKRGLPTGTSVSGSGSATSKYRKKWAAWSSDDPSTDKDADKRKSGESKDGAGEEKRSGSAIEAGHSTEGPICVMLAGYIAGFLRERMRLRGLLQQLPNPHLDSQRRGSKDDIGGTEGGGGISPKAGSGIKGGGSGIDSARSPRALPAIFAKGEVSIHELHQRLVVVELACHAAGHRHCEFLVASADGIETHTRRILETEGREKELQHIAPLLRLVAGRNNIQTYC